MAEKVVSQGGDRGLVMAEIFGHALGRTRFGRAVMARTTGSDSPVYRQLDWLPRRIAVHDARVDNYVTIPGDPYAQALPAKKWTNAAIVKVPGSQMVGLKRQVIGPLPAVEAIAYRSPGWKHWHVGVDYNGQDFFGQLAADDTTRRPNFAPYDLAVALRQGPDDVECAAGIFNPNTDNFTSTARIYVGAIAVQATELESQYPGILLV